MPPAANEVRSAVEIRRVVCDRFCAQDATAIESVLAEHFGPIRVAVAFDENASFYQMSCLWLQRRDKGSCFTFRTFQPGHLLNVVVDRWLSLFELFIQIDRAGDVEGKVVINFNDAGLDKGLAFCGNSSDYILVPDFVFIRSRGYAAEREHFDRGVVSWHERSNSVFWRGSSLGQTNQPIAEIPRARLCQIAKEPANNWLDAGFTELLDVSESDAQLLESMGLVRNHVPWQQLNRFKVHIDIDGHAASSGLFLKLLSGGLVLKIQSPNNYAQWYYDRLRPWVNFIPVKSDLSDLREIVSYCHNHDDLARRIAEEGRALALSLTYEKEFARALDCVASALRLS